MTYEPKPGLTYVDETRGALTLTFLASDTDEDVLARFKALAKWNGEYDVVVDGHNAGVYRVYLTQKRETQ
jgi:hypothetical protein